MLSQIPQGSQDHAHRMLQCLMVALRPLRVEEVAELLAFEFKAEGSVPKYRTDWRPNDQVEAVLSTCSSLISIVDDKDSQIVQFSHFSVKEFLMSDRLISSLGDYSQYQILPRPAHTILAQACLGSLLHVNGHVYKDIGKGLPLVDYAAKHWVTHAQFENVASCVKDGMETLFDCDKPHFGAWVGIYNIDEESSSESPSEITTPLYYSSLCGFSDLVEHLSTKHPQQVNVIGGKHKFPLLAALVGKHIRAAEILLEHGANVDIRGLRERTPLHEAIANVGMVQALLNKGADVNCRQDDCRTPLHLAASGGELKVARELMKHKAYVDSQDNEGATPLHLLLRDSSRDDDDVLDLARLLLEHTSDVDVRTTTKWTLLHAAACYERLEIVRMLLDLDANPNAETERGSTPLCLVSGGHYNSQELGASIARLFLGRGVDVNASAKGLVTPLHAAALNGRLEVVRALLDHGASPNMETEKGDTALHFVSGGTYDSEKHGVGIARLLLEHGVDVHVQNKILNNALHIAAFFGRLQVAQVLLDHGVNVDTENGQGETALHSVSRGGYNSQEKGANTARLLLERGVDVNARRKDGWTPLHLAAYKGRVKVVQALLDHGANVTLETEEGETALHTISRSEFNSQEQGIGTAQLLLERGVEVNSQRKDGWTPLHWAACRGRVEVVQALLDHGANVKLETKDCQTALHVVSRGEYSSQEQGVSIARLLLERGVDVNAREKDGRTALHLAALSGRVEVAQILLDHGANSKLEAKEGETALHIVSLGNFDSQEQAAGTARLLLERGVDVNARMQEGWTSLHCAAFRGMVKVAQVLLDQGANVNLENERGETALHTVSRGKFDSQEQGVGTARLLLEHGVDVNAQGKDGETSLHWAALKGRVEIAQILLDHGANSKLETKHGETALHMVSRGEYISQEQGASTARLLLERGVDVNAWNKYGWTSLHWAAFKGRVEVAQVLLDHGANAKLENKDGETALHIVSRGGFGSQEQGVSTARLLLECGVDVNALDKDGWTSLHWAAFKGRVEVAQVLLDHGANSKLENKHGETALHIVSRGSFDSQEQGVSTARLLLERGVDMNAWDKNGWTSLHRAAFKGRLEIARVLLDHGANAKLETKHGETALHLVSRGKYDSEEHGVGIARLLLERGVDVHVQNIYFDTALHLAAFSGRLEITQLLLSCGANPNTEDVQGRTPLLQVSRGKYKSQEYDVGIARLLLECGVDVDARGKDKITPLHYASFYGKLEIVQVRPFFSKKQIDLSSGTLGASRSRCKPKCRG